MTRLAITGSSGFIGGYIKRRAAELGISITEIGRNDLASLRDNPRSTQLAGKLDGVEAIVHAAGLAHGRQNATTEFDLFNHRLTRDLADTAVASGVKTFVFLSSIAVHGQIEAAAAIDSSTSLNPATAYGASKADAEKALKSIAQDKGLNVYCLRPPLVCGAGAPGQIGLLRRLILRGAPLPSIPTNARSLAGVRNLSDMALALARRQGQVGFFWAGPAADQELVSTNEMVRAIADGANVRLRLIPALSGLLRTLSSLPGLHGPIVRFIGDFRVDPREAWSLSGLRQRVTSLDELKATGFGVV